MLKIWVFSNIVALEMIAPNKPKPLDSKKHSEQRKTQHFCGVHYIQKLLARATGLEPVTYGLTVRCSTD